MSVLPTPSDSLASPVQEAQALLKAKGFQAAPVIEAVRASRNPAKEGPGMEGPHAARLDRFLGAFGLLVGGQAGTNGAEALDEGGLQALGESLRREGVRQAMLHAWIMAVREESVRWIFKALFLDRDGLETVIRAVNRLVDEFAAHLVEAYSSASVAECRFVERQTLDNFLKVTGISRKLYDHMAQSYRKGLNLDQRRD